MCIANLCLNKFILLLLLLLLPKDQSTVQFRFGTKLIKYCKCIIIDVGFAIDKNGNFEKKSDYVCVNKRFVQSRAK